MHPALQFARMVGRLQNRADSVRGMCDPRPGGGGATDGDKPRKTANAALAGPGGASVEFSAL